MTPLFSLLLPSLVRAPEKSFETFFAVFQILLLEKKKEKKITLSSPHALPLLLFACVAPSPQDLERQWTPRRWSSHSWQVEDTRYRCRDGHWNYYDYDSAYDYDYRYGSALLLCSVVGYRTNFHHVEEWYDYWFDVLAFGQEAAKSNSFFDVVPSFFPPSPRFPPPPPPPRCRCCRRWRWVSSFRRKKPTRRGIEWWAVVVVPQA